MKQSNNLMKHGKKACSLLLCSLLVFACKIENDIPYPTVEGNIESFAVEGQCSAPDGSGNSATINTSNRTVTLYVDDTVDLTQLRITRFTVSQGVIIVPDASACVNAERFPTTGFEAPADTDDTRVNFTNPVTFTLQTYQDYKWTVSVTQIIERNIDVRGQISAVVDVENHLAIIYVSPDEDLSNIQVNAMDLGGASGTVSPDPTTVHDFTTPQTFYVSRGWEEVYNEWTVYMYHSENNTTATAEVFPRTTSATLNGNIQSGKTPVIEYKESNAAAWNTLPSAQVSVNGTRYTAEFSGLTGNTTYQYRISIDGTVTTEQTFTTAPATPLTNGSFDNWSSEAANNGTLWYPWESGGSSFWDTGNRGATTIANSNSVPTEETSTGNGRAALLQTKWLVMKLAAGNLFTGDFALDGTHGILTLGREFSAFPSSLRFHCKYTTSTINRVTDRLSHMRGQNDTCHVYVALTTEKVNVSTRNEIDFDPKGSYVIAYGEFLSGENVSGTERNGYRQIDVPLEYYRNNVTPRYLVIVCSSSKYGNLFTGGEGSTLYLDEMELIYE